MGMLIADLTPVSRSEMNGIRTTAEEAKTAADEAKSTAGTAAASVNEYMDALLGLGTTDETEATDAE